MVIFNIPVAPTDDEAKKHNENLPGMGGVFNVVNLQLYHYAGIGQRSDSELQANNPVKYTDPDGRDIEEVALVDPGLGLMIAGRGSIGIAKTCCFVFQG
jgi:YD repeat protein